MIRTILSSIAVFAALSACSPETNDGDPEIRSLTPEPGAELYDDEPVTVVVEVDDPADPLIDLLVELTTGTGDAQAVLCARTPGVTGLVRCDLDLAAGTHDIVVTVTDAFDGIDDATMSLVVLPAKERPAKP